MEKNTFGSLGIMLATLCLKETENRQVEKADMCETRPRLKMYGLQLIKIY